MTRPKHTEGTITNSVIIPCTGDCGRASLTTKNSSPAGRIIFPVRLLLLEKLQLLVLGNSNGVGKS